MQVFALSLLFTVAHLQTPMQVTYAPTQHSFTKAVEDGVLKTVKGMEDTWNQHDMKGYADLLTEDCQWVNVVGMFWNGKPAVVKAHTAFHQTIFKNVSYFVEEANLREIAPHTVATVLRLRMQEYTTPDGKKVPEHQTHLSLILVDKQGKWLISFAQNTPIDVNAARFDPGK